MTQSPDPAHSHPAPSASDLKHAAEEFTEGPNIEASPWELEAARGELPLEGPHASDALDGDGFQARYDAWKEATVRFEAEMRAMREGDADARPRAQALAMELDRLHQAFMESSRPYLQAPKAGG